MKNVIILDIDAASKNMFALFTANHIPGLWGFKIGDQILYSGAKIAMQIFGASANIFVDLKHYDTEDRIRRIVAQYAALGDYAPKMLTISGDVSPAAIEAAVNECGPIKIIVTTLLSDRSDYGRGEACDVVEERIAKALASNADGITCPAWLLPELDVKHAPHLRGLTIVATGIRSSDALHHNHHSPRTAEFAFAHGATLAVVGREVTSLPGREPLFRLRKIIASCGLLVPA